MSMSKIYIFKIFHWASLDFPLQTICHVFNQIMIYFCCFLTQRCIMIFYEKRNTTYLVTMLYLYYYMQQRKPGKTTLYKTVKIKVLMSSFYYLLFFYAFIFIVYICMYVYMYWYVHCCYGFSIDLCSPKSSVFFQRLVKIVHSIYYTSISNIVNMNAVFYAHQYMQQKFSSS